MTPNSIIKIVKSKEHLIGDIEALKEFLNNLQLDSKDSWGNKELEVFTELDKLARNLTNIQSVIKRQYKYPKPIKLRRALSIELNLNWKTMIGLMQTSPNVRDMGQVTKKVKSYGWGSDGLIDKVFHKFLVPRGTLGFLMGIQSSGNKIVYSITIPEPVSMKIQKSNYIEITDDNYFSFNVSDEEKSTLKRAALNFFMGKCKGDNLGVVEKVNDLMKEW